MPCRRRSGATQRLRRKTIPAPPPGISGRRRVSRSRGRGRHSLLMVLGRMVDILFLPPLLLERNLLFDDMKPHVPWVEPHDPIGKHPGLSHP